MMSRFRSLCTCRFCSKRVHLGVLLAGRLIARVFIAAVAVFLRIEQHLHHGGSTHISTKA